MLRKWIAQLFEPKEPGKVATSVTYKDGQIEIATENHGLVTFAFEEIQEVYVQEIDAWFAGYVSFHFVLGSGETWWFSADLAGIEELGENLLAHHGVQFDYAVPKKRKVLYRRHPI